MIRQDVFVSYSHPDRDCAYQLTAQLEARGVSVWIAPRDIAPAADWAEEIIAAISSVRLMVLVFSGHCNGSPQVRREVERAVHRQVPILPFRIEEVLPAKSLEYFLSTQHWLDAFPPPREPYYANLAARVVCMLNEPAPLEAGPAAQASSGAAKAQSSPAAVDAQASRGAAVSTRNSLFALDVTEMESLERRLAHYVGPIAKYLVRQAAEKATSHDELSQLLAAEVEAASARQEFLEGCRQSRSRS